MSLELKDFLSAVSTFLGVVVALWQFNRQMKQKSIEEERAKWRERMRELSGQIAENAYLLNITTQEECKNELRAKLFGLISELKLRLNPFDEEKTTQKDFTDKGIFNLAKEIYSFPCPNKIYEFEEEMQLLLKWEWERAKKEAGFFSWFLFNGNKKNRFKPELDINKLHLAVGYGLIFILSFPIISSVYFKYFLICFKNN